MHTPEESSRLGDIVQQAESIANAANDSASELAAVGSIVICNVDLPIIIARGEVYVQAPLQSFFDAVSSAVVDVLRDLEAGVSEARRAALASSDIFPKIRIPRVVESDVVRDSGQP